jgi:hypothetical protein
VFQNLLRNYESDIESLNKQQKQAVEKAELTQATDIKHTAKKLKTDQVSYAIDLAACITHFSLSSPCPNQTQ